MAELLICARWTVCGSPANYASAGSLIHLNGCGSVHVNNDNFKSCLLGLRGLKAGFITVSFQCDRPDLLTSREVLQGLDVRLEQRQGVSGWPWCLANHGNAGISGGYRQAGSGAITRGRTDVAAHATRKKTAPQTTIAAAVEQLSQIERW